VIGRDISVGRPLLQDESLYKPETISLAMLILLRFVYLVTHVTMLLVGRVEF